EDDINEWRINHTLKKMMIKIQSNDPNIKHVRAGQNRPNMVRLVIDLKEVVMPQVFTLAPVGAYAHRLVLDLYPVNAPDPIAALIEKGEWSKEPVNPPAMLPEWQSALQSESVPPLADTPPDLKAEPKAEPRLDAKSEPKVDRLPQMPQITRMITIALDPGHGGE